MTAPPDHPATPAAGAATAVARPRHRFHPPSRSPLRVLLVCFYDPRGIPTVIETVAFLQSASRHSVTVLNLFEHRRDEGPLKLHPGLDLDAFDAVLIHNTVSYNIDNLRRLDDGLRTRLAGWGGVKVLLKQDENYRFRDLAPWIGTTGIDVLFTCLPPEAVPLVYPEQVVGRPRFVRMLTGYVTPTLRSRRPDAGSRPVDLGYRGSVQPLAFGRLAFEKRTIGEDVAARLAGRGLTLDISSRWEDRLGGDEWLAFLASCKATLGAESGASIFDLAGDLDRRIAELERAAAGLGSERERAEAVLHGLADLEGNVRYGQLSPRHFEAAACGAVQLLFPGSYSGVLAPGRHYLELRRDLSNLDDVLAAVLDPLRRQAIAEAAYDEVVLDPRNWIETFVAGVDDSIEEAWRARPGRVPKRPARHVVVLGDPAPPPMKGFVLHPVPGDGQVGPQTGLSACIAAPTGPAEALANGEVLRVRELLRLPEAAFCEAVGAPLGHAANREFRDSLERWAARVGTLLESADRISQPNAYWARDSAALAAAVLCGRRCDAAIVFESATPAGPLEAHAQFWRGLAQRLAAAAGAHVVESSPSGEPARQALERLAAPGVRELIATSARRPTYAAPGAPGAVRTAELPRRAAYAVLRGLWRALPRAIQDRIKPLARRLAARL